MCLSIYAESTHFHVSQGKYEDSVKECTKAIELNPLYKKALLRRAEAHEKLEHFEEAVSGIVEIFLLTFDYCYGRKIVLVMLVI